MARQSGEINPLFLVLLGIGGYFLWTRSARPAPALPAGGVRSLATTPRMQAPAGDNYIKWVQTSLNKLMGCGLVIDGIIGPLTKSCLVRFQIMRQLSPDGIIGPQTDYEIKSALGMPGFIEQPYEAASGDVWY